MLMISLGVFFVVKVSLKVKVVEIRMDVILVMIM